jgi:chromosome segregation ATPase
MSAAAGISAAKKRRGIVPETPAQVQQRQAPTGPMVTPIQILQNHELRLKHIEKQLSDAENYANSMVASEEQIEQEQQQEVENAQHKQVVETVLLQVNDYKTKSDVLEKRNETLEKKSETLERKCEVLEVKCVTLERKVEELSQIVQKIQMFSLESNHALLKLKRSVDEDLESRIRGLKQSYVPDDNLIQSVKFDTAAAISSMSAVSSFSQSEIADSE